MFNGFVSDVEHYRDGGDAKFVVLVSGTCWVQPTVTFPIGDHVNVLHDYKKTGPFKNSETSFLPLSSSR